MRFCYTHCHIIVGYIPIHPWQSNAATNLSFPNPPTLAYRLPVEFSIAYPGGGNQREWREYFNTLLIFGVGNVPHSPTKRDVLLDPDVLEISCPKNAKIIYVLTPVESSLNHCICILDQFLMGRHLTPLPVANSFGTSCKSKNVSVSCGKKAWEQKSM